MSVVLYRQGNTHTSNGIKCEMQVFNERSFMHLLEDGWFFSAEEAYVKLEEVEEPAVVIESQDEEIVEKVAITAGLKNKEIRAMAKEAGIKKWKTAQIVKLREALNDNQS